MNLKYGKNIDGIIQKPVSPKKLAKFVAAPQNVSKLQEINTTRGISNEEDKPYMFMEGSYLA